MYAIDSNFKWFNNFQRQIQDLSERGAARERGASLVNCSENCMTTFSNFPAIEKNGNVSIFVVLKFEKKIHSKHQGKCKFAAHTLCRLPPPKMSSDMLNWWLDGDTPIPWILNFGLPGFENK